MTSNRKRRLATLERKHTPKTLPLIVIHKTVEEPAEAAIARYWAARGEPPPDERTTVLYIVLNGRGDDCK